MDSNNDSFKERLIMVEHQQATQKEVLSEINETLKGIVETQHVIANQRKEIDSLHNTVEYVTKRLHEQDIVEAERKAREKVESELIKSLSNKVEKEIAPQQNRFSLYFKLAAIAIAAGWSVSLILIRFFLGA